MQSKHHLLPIFILALGYCFISTSVFAQGNNGQNGTTIKVKERNTGETRKNQKAMGNNTGDRQTLPNNQQGPQNDAATVKVKKNNTARKTGKDMANNTGDMEVYESRMAPPKNDHYVVVDNTKQRRQTKEMAKYSGDMEVYESRMQGPKNSGSTVIVREIDRKQEKDRARYSGDIPVNALEKRAQMRREKDRQVAGYQGDISVRTLEDRAKNIRQKSKKMANYQGDIIVHKRKEGMHPSSVYRGGKVKNSYQQKEKYRQKMLKKSQKKDTEIPNYQKDKKGSKPGYDSREADIWNLKQKQQPAEK